MLLVALKNRIEMTMKSKQDGQKIRNARKGIFYEGVKMCNSLPAMIKQCNGIQLFKQILKEYILNIIFLIILIDSIIILFAFIFLHFVFCILYFLYLKIAEKAI